MFFRVRFEELGDIAPVSLVTRMAWNSLFGEREVKLDEAKKTLRSRFDKYEMDIKDDVITETIITAHQRVKIVSVVSKENRERFFRKMLPALNVLYYEEINDHSLYKHKLGKFFHLKKPLEMFYNHETNTFYFQKEYGFLERFTVKIHREGNSFYVIATQNGETARKQYEKMKKPMEFSIENRKFTVLSGKKKTLPNMI